MSLVISIHPPTRHERELDEDETVAQFLRTDEVRLLLDPTSVTTHVRLIRRGLLRGYRGPTNHITYRLTEEGRAAYEEIEEEEDDD